jgi:hypothetical protein
MGTTFTAEVTYWHGEILDCSEPVKVSSERFGTFDEAHAWGLTQQGAPCPWPGRVFDDFHEVSEWLGETFEEGPDRWEEQSEVHRWTFEGERLDQELDAWDLRH